MDTAINIVMIFISLLLIAVILMQVRGQGTALFGAAESSFRTRRAVSYTHLRAHETNASLGSAGMGG